MNLPIVIREAKPQDVRFILSTWLNHFKNHSYFAKRITNGVYYPWHEKIAKRILGKPQTNILMATLPGDPEVLLAFLVYERSEIDPPIIHFAFVKETWRKMGIAKELIMHSKINLHESIFTHWTYDADQLVKKFHGMIYNPYKL